MSIGCIFFLYLVLITKMESFNINNTLPWPELYSTGIAQSLKGLSSSLFPNANFLKYILYTNTESNFTYKDFLNSYGSYSRIFELGNIIIGNDAQLGGIISESANSVIVALPSSNVQEIPYSHLSKYFPKGYSILHESDDPIYLKANGDIKGTFEDKSYYFSQCKFYSRMSDKNIFYLNKPLYIYIQGDIGYPNFGLFGFISDFNNETNRGLFDVVFYYTAFDQSTTSYFTTNSTFDNNIHLKKDGFTLYIFGALRVYIKKKIGYYNFTGQLTLYG